MTGTDTTKVFADRLQQLISDTGKTIKDIATETGIPAGSLSKYQNDNGEAGINSLVKLAKYFRVTTDYLLGLENCTTHENSDISKLIGLDEKAITGLQSTITTSNYSNFFEIENTAFYNPDLYNEMLKICPEIKIPNNYNFRPLINKIFSENYFKQIVNSAFLYIYSILLSKFYNQIKNVKNLNGDALAIWFQCLSKLNEQIGFAKWNAEKSIVDAVQKLGLNSYENVLNNITYFDNKQVESECIYSKRMNITIPLITHYTKEYMAASSTCNKVGNGDKFMDENQKWAYSIQSKDKTEQQYVEWLQELIDKGGIIDSNDHETQ